MIYSRTLVVGFLLVVGATASLAQAGEFDGNLACLAAINKTNISAENGNYDSKRPLAVVTATRYNERGFYVFTGGAAKFFKIQSQPSNDATSGYNGSGFNEDDEFYFRDENNKEVKYRAVFGGRPSPAADGTVRYDSFDISDITNQKPDKDRPKLFSLPRPMEVADDLARKAFDSSLTSRLDNIALTIGENTGTAEELRQVNIQLADPDFDAHHVQSGKTSLPRLPGQQPSYDRMTKAELLALKAKDERKIKGSAERAQAANLKARSKLVQNALDVCSKNGSASVQKVAVGYLKAEAATPAAGSGGASGSGPSGSGGSPGKNSN